MTFAEELLSDIPWDTENGEKVDPRGPVEPLESSGNPLANHKLVLWEHPAGHSITKDRFNWIVNHPRNKVCKGAFSAGRIQTYFYQPITVLWELETCCKVKLESTEKSTLKKALGLIAIILLFLFPAVAQAEMYRDSRSFNNLQQVWTVTAYCSCSRCCGKSDGVMASGKKAYTGAVACNGLPFGTKIALAGLGVMTVEDRGAKSHFGTRSHPKPRLDVWMSSHQAALKWGRRKVAGRIIR